MNDNEWSSASVSGDDDRSSETFWRSSLKNLSGIFKSKFEGFTFELDVA